jgi:methylated-DNA-[protein]-cysteine S-methyltransferase
MSRLLAWSTLPTPVGVLSVAAGAAGISRITFGPPPPGSVTGAGDADPQDTGSRDTGSRDTDRRAATAARGCEQLAEYFAGQRRVFDLPLDWSGFTPPRRRVLSVLFETVGFGETVTYGELARRAGLTGDGQEPPARVVGQFMGSNPCPVVIPCHRVVAGDGLGGYSGGTGIESKRWLLIFEGSEPATLDWDPAGAR